MCVCAIIACLSVSESGFRAKSNIRQFAVPATIVHTWYSGIHCVSMECVFFQSKLLGVNPGCVYVTVCLSVCLLVFVSVPYVHVWHSAVHVFLFFSCFPLTISIMFRLFLLPIICVPLYICPLYVCISVCLYVC